MQEPYRWSSVANISRNVLSIRYSLLPYYYSLFFMANHDPNDYIFYPSTGVVVKPLFFDFPNDPISLNIDQQFLVGSALHIAPQLQLGERGNWVREVTEVAEEDGHASLIFTSQEQVFLLTRQLISVWKTFTCHFSRVKSK